MTTLNFDKVSNQVCPLADKMWSGLDFDLLDADASQYGINAVIVSHPCFPDLSNKGFPGINGLLLEHPFYWITSIRTEHWPSVYTEDDGLDIDRLAVGDEFYYIGVDTDTKTFKCAWIHSLKATPIKRSELNTSYFPEITTPTDFSDVSTPGNVTVTWTLPTALETYSESVSIDFGDSSSSDSDFEYDSEWGDQWLTTTFDLSQTAVVSPTWFNVRVTARSNDNMSFVTKMSFSIDE